MNRFRPHIVLALVAAVLLALAPNAAAAEPRWVAGWTSSPMGVGSASPFPSGFADRTVRNVVRMGTGGSDVRVKLSNEWGSRPLRLSSVEVARRTGNANVDPASRAQVRFGGHPFVTIPVGGVVVSDPVRYPVRAGTDLAVSLYAPGPTGRPTWHLGAQAASHTSSGNRVGQASGTGFSTISSWYFLTGVEVRTTEDLGTVVAFGDSITEGAKSSFNRNQRYPDHLATRLQRLPAGRQLSVVNAGIGSNRLLKDNVQTSRHQSSGLDRYAQDVLSQPNLRAVVMLMGTNDLSTSNRPVVSAHQVIVGYLDVIKRARARGATVVVGTIPPGGRLDPADRRRGLRLNEPIRREINGWIRNTTQIDTVVDFDKVLRDPADPERIRPAFRGDEVHPNDAGYRAMADAIPVRALTR